MLRRARPNLALFALTAALIGACASDPAAPPAPVVPDDATAAVPESAAKPSETATRVELAAALSNARVRAGHPDEVFARIQVRAADLTTLPPPSINVALVIDTSGSMRGAAIEHARSAALRFMEQMGDKDRLSVIAFDSTTHVVLASTPLDPDTRKSARASIDGLVARGTTDLAGGLAAGIAQVQRDRANRQVNRVVLLSDGLPNNEAPLLAIADQARHQGIAVTALGLGLEFNETLLASLAQRSGGKFHFIEQPDAIAAVFRDEVLRLQRVVARQVVVSLRPGPGITVAGAIGHQLVPSGRNFTLTLGDLAEGETRELVVGLGVAAHRQGAAVELMDVVASYNDAIANGRAHEETLYLSADSDADDERVEQGRNLDVELQVARLRAADMTVQAIALARAGRVRDAQSLIDTAIPQVRGQAKRFDDAELRKQIDALVELRGALPAMAPPKPAAMPRHGLGRPSGGRGGTPMPSPAVGTLGHTPSKAKVLRQHDDAMKLLQGG